MILLLRWLGRFFDARARRSTRFAEGYRRLGDWCYRPVFRPENRRAARNEVETTIAREIELSKTPSAFIGRRRTTDESPFNGETR